MEAFGGGGLTGLEGDRKTGQDVRTANGTLPSLRCPAWPAPPDSPPPRLEGVCMSIVQFFSLLALWLSPAGRQKHPPPNCMVRHRGEVCTYGASGSPALPPPRWSKSWRLLGAGFVLPVVQGGTCEGKHGRISPPHIRLLRTGILMMFAVLCAGGHALGNPVA